MGEEEKREEKRNEEKEEEEIACVSSYGTLKETLSLSNQQTQPQYYTFNIHSNTHHGNGCCCHIHPSFLFV